MSGNSVLNHTKYSSNNTDEWYTTYETIEVELKKLICTGYEYNNTPVCSSGRVLIVSEMPGEQGQIVDDKTINTVLHKKGVIRNLKGNGDFRSLECLNYLRECDICCTNPPFSLFVELFALIVKYNKKYLLIGNQNANSYGL